MKVEKHTPTPPTQFKPISVTITIETEEELEALKEMALLNITIPEVVANRSERDGDASIIEKFLRYLQISLLSR